MKKYLCFLLILILSLTLSCKKNKEEDEPVDEFKTIDFEATHQYDIIENNLYSYMIVKGKPTSNGFSQALTFYSFIIKNNIENRDYEYFQVDYNILKNGEKTLTTYYHIFDSSDDPKGLYAQNFMPYIVVDGRISDFQTLVKYSYHEKNSEEEVKKEVTYKEEMIEFDKSKEYLDIVKDFNLLFYETENSNSVYNSYKLMLNFSTEKYSTGHFDFQVFLEIGDEIYPFYGVYNYPVMCGSFLTISDEKLEVSYKIKTIYWDIIHYDKEGNKTEILYKENLL